MMTENNNPVVMTWFQQQQTPAGWFDLLIIMIEGMLNNAGELESQPFLRQMGASLAETHPLPASETVGDLEANINRLLTHFHWGVVTIDVGEDGLRLRHQALPVSRDEAGACAGATRSVPYSRGYILAGCRVREAVPT
ncbi:cellulose synthase operon protein D [Klebsiella pneumoniae subsp. rhinoscleromatis]|nr:cellulose synthase operon protein D [Klebsiella pneumoniae subsp. rhinoscleromatis]